MKKEVRTVDGYLQIATEQLSEAGQPEIGEKQSAYMRNLFKIAPDSVRLFLKNNPQLAPLTKREAKIYL